jgi:hypothetical protein
VHVDIAEGPSVVTWELSLEGSGSEGHASDVALEVKYAVALEVNYAVLPKPVSATAECTYQTGGMAVA